MGKNFAHRKPTQTATTTTVPSETASKPTRGQGERLTLNERYQLLELHKAHPDWTYAQLGHAAGCSHETARLTCIAAGRSAVDLMAAYAAPMFHLWRKAAMVAASRGDHRPTKEWLLHAAVLDPLPDSAKSSGTSITIVNNPLPGMPDPVTITVQSADSLPVKENLALQSLPAESLQSDSVVLAPSVPPSDP